MRRYLCVGCGALITVVPRGVSRWRHYSAAAVGIALSLYGALRESASAVRRRVSPWRVLGQTAEGWSSLRRWTAAARRGALFLRLGAVPGTTARQVAEHAAAKLAAYAPPTARHLPPSTQAFVGAIAVA